MVAKGQTIHGKFDFKVEAVEHFSPAIGVIVDGTRLDTNEPASFPLGWDSAYEVSDPSPGLSIADGRGL